jgi:hypothetical protein
MPSLEQLVRRCHDTVVHASRYSKGWATQFHVATVRNSSGYVRSRAEGADPRSRPSGRD